MSVRVMRLTAELVARCHREVADDGARDAYDRYSDADYDRAVARLLGTRPDGPIWIFAYGSLIWKRAFDAAEVRRALARGWHRGFSMKIERYRATPDQPGYMLCLDPGGQCEGVIMRLDSASAEATLRALLDREVGSDEALDAVRWIDVDCEDGPVRALTFYAGPHRLDIYDPDRSPEEVAHGLARACGHWGSGAEYLYNTVRHLEEMGIHDPGLWDLQDRVAAEIERLLAL